MKNYPYLCSNIKGITIMRKIDIIATIFGIINTYGAFSIFDLENDESPIVNEMGSLAALAEDFKLDSVVAYVYDITSSSSDELEHYEVQYSELSKSKLKEILELAKIWKELQLEEK